MYFYSLFVIKTTIWKYQRILRTIGEKLVARDIFWASQIGPPLQLSSFGFVGQPTCNTFGPVYSLVEPTQINRLKCFMLQLE